MAHLCLRGKRHRKHRKWIQSSYPLSGFTVAMMKLDLLEKHFLLGVKGKQCVHCGYFVVEKVL